MKKEVITRVQLPTSMGELESKLREKSLLIDSSQFETFWTSYVDNEDSHPITGQPGYYSYKIPGGYHKKAAISKAIWANVEEIQVIHEGFYLQDTDRLLALVINPHPTTRHPKYIFIIKGDDGYLSKEQASLNDKEANDIRGYTKDNLSRRYKPTLSW